ncbi:MAG: TIGR00296 family protein [Candidatus Pacearchaeota archaeon]
MLTRAQGKKLVRLARDSIASWFAKKQLNFEKEKKEFHELQGVFVTLHTYPRKELRGCIGFPYPTLPLAEAVFQAARSAAFSDPRFEPLQEKELNHIIIEISILTKPQIINATGISIPGNIKVGQDGLIIEFAGHSGLLLPQVATELGWDANEFLRGVCNKAGLPSETWLNPLCHLYKFQAQIFSETKPGGRIIEKNVKSRKPRTEGKQRRAKRNRKI